MKKKPSDAKSNPGCNVSGSAANVADPRLIQRVEQASVARP